MEEFCKSKALYEIKNLAIEMKRNQRQKVEDELRLQVGLADRRNVSHWVDGVLRRILSKESCHHIEKEEKFKTGLKFYVKASILI